MSKLDALLVALIWVGTASALVILAILVISILTVLKPIGWLVLGQVALVTILIAIGIYQYDKHF